MWGSTRGPRYDASGWHLREPRTVEQVGERGSWAIRVTRRVFRRPLDASARRAAAAAGVPATRRHARRRATDRPGGQGAVAAGAARAVRALALSPVSRLGEGAVGGTVALPHGDRLRGPHGVDCPRPRAAGRARGGSGAVH